jgi:hypothetical protein
VYWFWSSSLKDILLYCLLCGLWALGGWLIVSHAFRLKSIERIASGLGTGMLLFIIFSDWLAQFLPLPTAFWSASGLVLALGLAAAWRSGRRPRLSLHDLKAWPLLLALAALTLLFTYIQRGLAIFDEYQHLPMISIMAAGDIPPHFYLDPQYYFAYHYSLHVLAASMVRLAGLTPWSAWDLARSLAIALMLVLGWLWVRRVTRSVLAAYLGTILLTFGGGARWVLLLVPQAWLRSLTASVPLIIPDPRLGTDLAALLRHAWALEGAGQAQFPFAFHNGIFVPAFFVLGSSGAMPFVTFFLLLLLLPHRRFSAIGWVTWASLFASMALSAEHVFVAVWGGIALAIGYDALRKKRWPFSLKNSSPFQWTVLLAASLLMAVLQGGFITEAARGMMTRFLNISAGESFNARAFGLRWPPSLYSAHFGPLSLFEKGSLVVLLAELGLTVLLIFFVFNFTRRRFRQQAWFWAGLGIGSLLSFFFPLFFYYGVDRSTTRLPATALWLWVLIAIPMLWAVARDGKIWMRVLLAAGYLVTVLGGVVTFGASLPAIFSPQYSYFIQGVDTYAGAAYWNRLPEDTQVLDSLAERAVTIFGRASRANSDIYTALPEWENLIEQADPVAAARAGYSFIYLDPSWWESLTPEQVRAFTDQSCVKLVEKFFQDDGRYRLLYDIRACNEEDKH